MSGVYVELPKQNWLKKASVSPGLVVTVSDSWKFWLCTKLIVLQGETSGGAEREKKTVQTEAQRLL